MLDKHQLQGIRDRANYYTQRGETEDGDFRLATKSERRLAKDILKLLCEVELLNQVVRSQIKAKYPEFDVDEIEAYLCWLKVEEDWSDIFQRLVEEGD